jgi:hypothetical protein
MEDDDDSTFGGGKAEVSPCSDFFVKLVTLFGWAGAGRRLGRLVCGVVIDAWTESSRADWMSSR